MDKETFIKHLKSLLEDLKLKGSKEFKKIYTSFCDLSKKSYKEKFWKEGISQEKINKAYDCIRYSGRLFNSRSGHQTGWLEHGIELLIKELEKNKNNS